MKSNPKLVLTRKAQADIQDIAQYTLETWGEAQARIYNSKLFKGMERIRENPNAGHSREDILPDYKALVVQKHLVIYLPQKDKITVVRILHQSRDIKSHL